MSERAGMPASYDEDLSREPVTMCPRCGGQWGEDMTCENCTDEQGNPRELPEDDNSGTFTEDDQGNWHKVELPGSTRILAIPVWVAAWTDPDASDEDDSYALVGVFADGDAARQACEDDWSDSEGWMPDEDPMSDYEWLDELHGVGNGHFHYIIWPATIGERIKPTD